jgi:hypothetical protein
MLKVASVLRNPFSFLFTRSSQEERVAAYVIREHERGRSLDEILEDPYVRNRLTPAQRARLLDRPDIIRAVGDDTVAATRASLTSTFWPTPRSRARSSAAAPIATSHAARPFDLKTTMSSSEARPRTSPATTSCSS